jgi:hypothetical protein
VNEVVVITKLSLLHTEGATSAMKRTAKSGKAKRRTWFSAKVILEWRPGGESEFPAGLKEELDDIENFDARWKPFMDVYEKYAFVDKDMIDVDEIMKSMKKGGVSERDAMMFLKRLRRLNLVRFTFDNESLMGKLDRITELLN